MASPADVISAINASKNSWNIVARVVRLWAVSMGDRSRTTTSLEMILADVEGNRIHASIRKVFVKKYEKVLKEGSVYSFNFFSVTVNGGDYRLSRHDWKININGSTKIVLLPDSVVPFPGHDFTPFNEILGGLLDSSYLIDVIGILTSVGEERAIDRNGIITKMNVIELANAGFKVTCSLWGTYVDHLNKFTLANGGTATIIIALFGLKVKEFQGKISLQNSMYSTKLIFNPEYPEAGELKRSLTNEVTCSQGVAHLTSSGMPSLTDDFLKLNERRNISQLDCLADYNGCFIVLGTIESLVEPHDWWYLSCKCHRAVFPDSVAYYCNFCDRRVFDVIPRYRLKVSVIDDTGSAVFLIFDRPASTLFSKDCAEMVANFEKDDNNVDTPPAISALVGREFLFKVDVKSQDSRNATTTYNVKRLTTDTNLITSFKSKPVNNEDLPIALVTPLSSVSQPIGCCVGIQPTLESHAVTCDTSKGKKQVDDLSGLKRKENPGKQVAEDVADMMIVKCNPKLLKTIKVEKP